MTYNTREEAVASVATDAERVQYDGEDAERLKNVAGTFTHHAMELIESMGAYANETLSEVDEEAESRMGYARRDLIEKWATMQLAVSKIAHVLRVDGETAYDRLVTALNAKSPDDSNIDMSGL